MILVILGTQDKPFKRLLEKVEEQIDLGNITEEVVVQAGNTIYESSKMKIFDLVPMEKLEELINDANIIITHGGVGSIISSVKKGKKVIACARLEKYGEHVNDHQLQIINIFSKERYLVSYNDGDDLGDILKSINTFVPEKYVSSTDKIIDIIDKFIGDVLN